jgi:osmotically inducible lipoprotein OsmB
MRIGTLAAAAILSMGLGLSACNSPGEGGGRRGRVSGGRRGALAGAGIGAAGGAIVGAASTPQPRYGYEEPVYAEPGYRRGPRCPYGAYQDEYGNVYCR